MKIKDCKSILKIGDWVKTNGDGFGSCKFFEGYIGEIREDSFFVWQNEKDGSCGNLYPITKGYKYSWEIRFGNENEIEIIKSGDSATKTMNLKEKFVQVFLSEPEKTFRKVGITNGDGILTDDGQKIFLSWLLKKHGDDFKKEVVDELVKDEEEK